jgi:uncharacterized protein YcbK (DUF882 family)
MQPTTMLVSRHFVYPEFASKPRGNVTGVPYPTEWIDGRLQPLCDMLDKIRDAWGGPVSVVSGYRSPELNALLREHSTGVAQNSQHVMGTAADIAPVPADDVRAVARFCAMVAKMVETGLLPGIGGLGLYPGWAHVDIRSKPDSGHVARWTGLGFGSEPT